MLYHKNTASDFVFYQLTQSKYNLPNSHQYNNPRPHPHNNLYIYIMETFAQIRDYTSSKIPSIIVIPYIIFIYFNLIMII